MINKSINIKCNIITHEGGGTVGNFRYFPNLNALSTTGTLLATHAQIINNMLPSSVNNAGLGEGIAYYNDKIWIMIYYHSSSSSLTGVSRPLQLYKGILELNLLPNLTLSFSRIINIPSGHPGDFHVRCSYSSNELLMSYDNYPNWPSQAGGSNNLFHFDISTTTANITPLFPTVGMCKDAIYISQSNTYVTTEAWGDTTHYDSQGNILGTAGSYGHAAFCHNGEVYLGRNPAGLRMLDVPTMSLNTQPTPAIPLGDAASNPECCNQEGDWPRITSWDCVQIGDHPKFGHKCIEVIGPQGPLGGQYATKQDCIDSPCSQEAPYILDPGFPGVGGGLNPSPVTGGGTGDSITGGTVNDK